MPTATPRLDLTIPQDTDLIADIAAIVASGLTDLENSIFLAEDSLSAASPVTDWPRGLAVMGFNSTANGGWPEAGGIIVNIRRITSAATHQLCFAGSGTTGSRIQVRAGATTYDWSDWQLVGGAEANGQVSGAPPADGGVVALPVTFPTGRFTVRPLVWATVNDTARPDQVACSVSNITLSGCTVYLSRPNGETNTVAWQAKQGD